MLSALFGVWGQGWVQSFGFGVWVSCLRPEGLEFSAKGADIRGQGSFLESWMSGLGCGALGSANHDSLVAFLRRVLIFQRIPLIVEFLPGTKYPLRFRVSKP